VKALLRHPWAIIIAIGAITLFFAFQLPKAQLNNDVMTFVPEDHPDKVAMDEVEETFGTSVPMSVGIEFPRGTIFAAESIELVRTLTAELEELERVKDVTSMTNSDYIRGTEDGMAVSALVEEFEGSESEIRELKAKLLSWDTYEESLYSDNFRATQILVGVDLDISADAREELYFDIKEVLANHESPEVNYYLAGEPAIAVLLSTNMRNDVATLVPLVIVVVLVALYLFFRRPGGVILPIVTVLISTTWTIGAMALLGISLSLVATVIPVLMIAVGSAYGIHIVNHYFHEVDERRRDISAEEHRQIIFNTLNNVGKPVFLAGLTTIIGFGALTTSEVGPMRSFGVFTAIGVAVALLVALTLIPSLLLVRGSALEATQRTEREPVNDSFLLGIYNFFAGRKIRIMVLALLVTGVASWGASKLIVDNELITYFKRGTEIRVADRFLRENFGGTRTFHIEVTGEEAGDLTDPEVLQAMDDLATYLETTYPEKISKVLSYTDFIKRMNQVMHVGEAPPWDYVSGERYGPGGTSASGGGESGGKEGADQGGSTGGSDSSEGSVPSFFDETSSLPPAEFWRVGQEGEAGDESDFSEGFGSGEFGTSFEQSDNRGAEDTADAEPGVPDEAPGPAGEEPANVGTGSPAAGFSYADFASMLNRAYRRADRLDLSLGELLELVNREVNHEGAAFYEIPYNPEFYPAETRRELSNLISQYLLIYSGSLDEWSDDSVEPSKARMLVQLRTTGNIFTEQAVEEIERYAALEFPEGYSVRTAGVAIVEKAITRLISNAQIYSIIVSLTLVFIIIAITYRSLVAGFYGILPLGLAVLVNFGVMGFSGIKLDVSTAMVASVAIGIGIDYTIHFLSAYHRERRRTEDLEDVEKTVLRTTGKAIIFNAVSVAAGFAVLLLSNFNPLMYMGLLIALTMFTSSIAAMTVLPVLLDIFNPRFIRKAIRKEA
jgi:hypothetical protein